MKKEIAKMLSGAARSGLTVKQSRNGHFKVYAGSRLVAVLASTPSCSRGLLNARSDLRKLGVDC